MASLKILQYMLQNAEGLSAISAAEITSDLNLSKSTVYFSLRQLITHGFVLHTASGYVLSELVLTAGIKRQSSLSRVKLTDQEKLYGPHKR